MKKIGVLILICLAFLFLSGLFGDFNIFTGKIIKDNIIVSIFPQGEVNTHAVRVMVITSERATCMYNLGLKNTVSFRFYNPMTVTGELKHSQLLNDLKNNDYSLSIKCTDDNNFAHIKDVDFNVKISGECIRYCEYADDCDEYASDGCGLTCKRNTDGISCGGGKICKDGFCIEEEKPIVNASKLEEEPSIISEKPVIAEESKGLISKIISFLRWVFR